jgi:hypothetical protein
MTVACNNTGSTDGIVVESWLADVEHMYVSGCAGSGIVDTSNAQTSGSYFGIEADVQGDPVGSTISGNKVLNDGAAESATATYTYIALTRTNYGTGNVAVTGNVVVGRQSSDVGPSFTGNGYPLAVSSSGNRVSEVGTVRSVGVNATVDAGV